ncbi:MAG: bifunctional phosphopantothenoylcysteine decarboxylase/phosphopantothenate--cysteine ligase CoaBC [Eubacterium sp.]|nr:bifunctional phosphopantothenoylcysteine decarboxylase/phosphopantothenate--cysteine ligase CoaBC [Eubacterium sp.]
MLTGKHVLLGVTGGIAAYKACELVSSLIKQGADVHVVMTKNATEFVTPLTFDALTHNRTVVDTFDRQHSYEIEHISLAELAVAVMIAPASADFIAKIANGIADDMLTTTVLACDCPKLIAPAMNTRMYENPATQRNIRRLQEDGWEVIEPDSGRLACGTTGKGKLVAPSVLLEAIDHAIAHEKDMEGLKVLVTAGPTQEAIDPVRYLTNHSSGKMGYAIAQAAAQRGAEVTLVSGKTNLTRPRYVDFVDITSAEDMYQAVTGRAKEQDIIIKAAAVADFKPASVAEDKIKKMASDDNPSLALARTKDILAFLGEHKAEHTEGLYAGRQFLCGFSMETRDMLANSRKKLEKKNLDMVCANNVKEAGAGFAVDTNVLTLITKEEEIELPLMSKYEAANALLNQILKMRAAE